MKKLLITAAALGLTIGFVATASATNGYFSHGYSLKNKGMAGAGVAVPTDAMGVSSNPATLTEVGNRFDLGLSIFSPSREYSVTPANRVPNQFDMLPLAGGTVESDSNYFPIPNMAYSGQINENSAWGIAMYGNGGMNTDYPASTFYGSIPTGVDLMQLFIAPTYAFKFAEKHSFGITPIIGVQFFEAKGLQMFGGPSPPGFGASADDTKLTNNGHDSAFGFGGRIGYLGQLTDQFSIGLAWQSKIYMDEFDDYAGLYAEQGDFDIPSNWTIGLAWMATPEVTLAFDVQQIYYSDINSISNPMLPNFMTAGLGPDQGAGFGWEDMTVYKFGLQWDRTEQWTYRFGYSYGEQPIPETEVMFNILAPGVVEQHATFGLTYTFENQGELDFSFMYAFSNDVSGINPFANNNPGYTPPDTPADTGPSGLPPNYPGVAGSPQIIEISMSQWELGIGYSWKF
jgi:long-chain fatty acid transport protein